MRNILLMLLLLTIPYVYAEPLESHSYHNILNITRCEGPVTIRTVPQNSISNSEDLLIEGCEYISNNRWRCNCRNNFNVNIMLNKTSRSVFNVNIEYYVLYIIPQNLNDQTLNDGNKRLVNIRELSFISFRRTLPQFDIEDRSKFYLYIFLIFVLIIIILIIAFFKIKKKTNYDSLSYKVKKEEDINDILNHLK